MLGNELLIWYGLVGLVVTGGVTALVVAVTRRMRRRPGSRRGGALYDK